MTDDKDFQRRLEAIERGIRQLESAADPSLRAAAQQLVQSILDLHGRSLERLLELAHASGEGGPALIDQLGADPLIGPLLILHSLHPLTLEARVLRALDAVRVELRAAGADVELVSVHDGVVRVRVLGSATKQAAVERALVDAAPDAVRLDVDGVVDAVVGFVPVELLRAPHGSARPSRVSPLAATPEA